MSDTETSQAQHRPQSREEFVRHLRSKAESAAEASVHHAALSQQYMELSQKFSQLAERAGSTGIAELQSSLKQLEGQMHQASSPSPPTATVLRPSSDRSNFTTSPLAALEPPEVASDSIPVAGPGMPPFSGETVSQTSPRSRRSVSTRAIVERARAVRLAAKRVKVKARKSDLQPRLRTATEELVKGRSSIATSLCLLALTLVVMNLISWQLEDDTPLPPLMAAFADEVTEVEEPMPIEPPEEVPGEQTEQDTEQPVEEPESEPEPPKEEPKPEDVPEPEPEPPVETEMADALPPETADSPVPAATDANASADVVDNRSAAGREALLAKYGGSQASESAVQHGLEWLISVQHPQGYWDFINVGASKNAGTINNPIGGTAYAMLPFLAAGQTHQEGDYQKQIGAALSYLIKTGVRTPAGLDFRGMINKQSDDKAPNEAYYVHGAATLALCEAYGMTKDRRLKAAAEGAIRFIVNSQDPRGGGWRYNPQEPGSTSVTAIQVMALMAGKKAGFKVPESTFAGVTHYLDSVQVDEEGRYGYEVQKKTYAGSVTAMALLCRMYLGWGRDDGDLRAGVALLDKAGPYDNLYTLYFATQVMKNWGGKEWERWNVRLRDDLVGCQETDGPAKGSWKPRTGAIHAKQGGRLLTTALATLTLQVYYRYKPLLSEENTAKAGTGDDAP
ncbi:MAG: hypothetical protein R3C59_03730 [Planctomycetaceae bacterium]